MRLRAHLAMDVDAVQVQCDATALRGFVTYVIRRHNGSQRRVSWSDFIISIFGELGFLTFFGFQALHVNIAFSACLK